MRSKFNRCLSVISLLLIACNVHAEIDFKDLVPKDGVVAKVMSISAGKKADEISARMKESLNKQPEWTSSYIKKHYGLAGGEILPYHPNFGVTKEEYDHVINASNNMQLVEVGEVKISIKVDNGEYEFALIDINTSFNGLKVNAKDLSLITSIAHIKQSEYIKPDQKDALIGRFQGYKWDYQQGDYSKSGNAKALKFTLAKIEGSGDIFLSFQALVVSNGYATVKDDFKLIVRNHGLTK